MPDKELLSEHGFGNASLLYVRREFGGLDVLEARQRTYGQGNARPKNLVADTIVHVDALQVVAKGKPEPASQMQSNEGRLRSVALPFSAAVSGAEHRPTLNAHGAFQELA